jgi:Na+/H+ antiporter NhaD/arsenite permease-like protein
VLGTFNQGADYGYGPLQIYYFGLSFSKATVNMVRLSLLMLLVLIGFSLFLSQYSNARGTNYKTGRKNKKRKKEKNLNARFS